MSKKPRLFRLKGRKSLDETEDGRSGGGPRQTTISKFFVRQKSPEASTSNTPAAKKPKLEEESGAFTTREPVVKKARVEEEPGAFATREPVVKKARVEEEPGASTSSGPVVKKARVEEESEGIAGVSKQTLDKLSMFSLSGGSSRKTVVDNGKYAPVDNGKDAPIDYGQDVTEGWTVTAEVALQHKAYEKKGASESNEDFLKFVRKPKVKYTPLELQVLDLKRKYTDALLFVECGYKYRFFGEDAEIAARELNIYAHVDHQFMTASIPVHRLQVHVRRLVSKGYKVGVVNQTETAALKAAGVNKSAPFERKLTALYTRATLIGDDMELNETVLDSSDTSNSTEGLTAYILCAMEVMVNKKVTIGMVAVQPSTGDFIYDQFEDLLGFPVFSSRLAHIQPAEILLPNEQVSDGFIRAASDSLWQEERVRIERLPIDWFQYSDALRNLTRLEENGNNSFQELAVQPPAVVSCASALVTHLKEFGLERVLHFGRLNKFTTVDSYLQLDEMAVHNLELFSNSATGSLKGSLLWILNHTNTKFGARLLQQWISHPLRDITQIRERQDAIAEILESSTSPLFTQLKNALKKLPDLERGLTAVAHGKCSPWGFYSIIAALKKLYQLLSSMEDHVSDIESIFLKKLLTGISEAFSSVHEYISNIDEKAAKEGNKTHLFKDVSVYPAVHDCTCSMEGVMQDLDNLRERIRTTLRISSFDYKCVNGQEYLIEVKNTQLKAVPSSWMKINSTKQLCRYRSPEVERLHTKLCQLREKLSQHCKDAWLEFLDSFSKDYQRMWRGVKQLAELDAIFSLADVAKQDGYCKPTLVERPACINVESAWHPVVAQLMGSEGQFVPNDICLRDGVKCMVITGPNMGGKSCYLRQVAILVVMAQIGAYVPAKSAELSVFDAVYTRMGGRDDMNRGRSSLMVEVQEASESLKKATPYSLVIMDELGRGTATHDGTAIAQATLRHLVGTIGCATLFVTHYPEVVQVEHHIPETKNYHMGFMLQNPGDGEDHTLTFLYQLKEGASDRSFGLNVARMADLPRSLLCIAEKKSRELEDEVLQKRREKQTLINTLSAQGNQLANQLSEVHMSD